MLDSPMRRTPAEHTADTADSTGGALGTLPGREDSGSELLMGVERGGPTREPLMAMFAIMGLTVAATVAYTVSTDGTPFRAELLTAWMVATLVDCYVAFLCCYAWIFYKEQSWLARAGWLVAVLCTGSVAITLYIVLQLLKSRGRTAAHLLTSRAQ